MIEPSYSEHLVHLASQASKTPDILPDHVTQNILKASTMGIPHLNTHLMRSPTLAKMYATRRRCSSRKAALAPCPRTDILSAPSASYVSTRFTGAKTDIQDLMLSMNSSLCRSESPTPQPQPQIPSLGPTKSLWGNRLTAALYPGSELVDGPPDYSLASSLLALFESQQRPE
ncbi:hypothetical protein GMRT_15982 [Giardia muris]|uniref:Uncharacterized protein n=1 Tax=Giardia muris TaxID=5742 RepID=A0A4Z1T5S2_GIAMU|nr:hypothetical protein GMRT_15982 [Giardia muris]|eukprot:TNJ29403.1 hypothetical protein GMRT_15982 [Giardia muris]